MTLHIIAPPDSADHVKITSMDAKFVNASIEINIVDVSADPYEQIKKLATVDYNSGDVVCMAGLCPRHHTFLVAELAKSKKENYMPGCGVDHRSVELEPNKINFRKPIEANGHTAWPYVMVIGDPDLAKKSFELLPELDTSLYWSEYVPEEGTLMLEHLLAVVASTGLWETPNWFKVVDLSVRDLELAPVMYASHMWHDWIAFYPSNGNFKLENHTQLSPVWLAGSTKPLEYWKA